MKGLLVLLLSVPSAFAAPGGSPLAPDDGPALEARLAPEALLTDAARAGDRVVAVGERGHILLSDDSGRSWRQAPVPTRALLTAVFFQGKKLGWAVGHDAVVLRTLDGGESWTVQYASPSWQTPLLDAAFLTPLRGFAFGAYGRLLETRDGGEHWSLRRLLPDEEPHLNAVALAGGRRLVVASEFGYVHRSRDGGASWDAATTPYEGSYFGALSPLPGAALVFGLRGKVMRSDEFGAAWREVPTPTKMTLQGGTLLEDGTVVLVGAGGTVLVSRDAGRSFAAVQRASRAALSSAVEAPDGSVLLFGENGVERLERSRL